MLASMRPCSLMISAAAVSTTILSWSAAKVFFWTAALSLPSSSSRQAILWSQVREVSVATAWMVFRMATESALRIRLSIWPEEGSLENRLSIETLTVEVLAIALPITPEATTLLLTKDEDDPEIAPRLALGKLPSVITPPVTMLEAPVEPEVTMTAPLPTPPPTPEPFPREPDELTQRSETPVSAPDPPPTETRGTEVERPPAPVELELEVQVVVVVVEVPPVFRVGGSTVAAVVKPTRAARMENRIVKYDIYNGKIDINTGFTEF